MKLHLNLSLRRALLATMAALCSLASSATAGIADERYDLQYYLDFSYNKGIFAVGETGIKVTFQDGSSVNNPYIALMPNLDSFARKLDKVDINGTVTWSERGGANLFAPQYVSSAAHCDESSVYFLTEGFNTSVSYSSAGYSASPEWINGGSAKYDWSVQRLDKIVTEVAYTPYATDDFINSLKVGDVLYRLGTGGFHDTTGAAVVTGGNALGGLLNISSKSLLEDDETWALTYYLNNSPDSPPLEIGSLKGDSGSPVYAWDSDNKRFVQVGAASTSNVHVGYENWMISKGSPTIVEKFVNDYTVKAAFFSGTETIIWSAQDSATGKGTLTQGEVSVDYTGKGTSNTLKDTLGLTFSTTDADNVQHLQLQGSVDMGAGALTFESGKWQLSEKDTASTFNSAGFVINAEAELTLDLTATANEEWRKVGEGTLTIVGSGDNEAVLRVGGGTTVYNITTDETGNITGCTLGNTGETRLNRTNGYAASSVRLEGGVAIVVLMEEGQFKKNSVDGDTFTFGNDGGLLNLNGHSLSWGVINQQGSGKGARIGNFTPLGEERPGDATFTYTGTGTFDGCFMDEGAGENKAQLAVVYDNNEGGTWTLTGNHSNVGGFTVQAGTMVLQGTNTPHVMMTDSADWTYASLIGSDVTVKNGGTFQLSHHAIMEGNVTVESGGTYVLNQTVNAASESISGSMRQDMAKAGITSLIGNVTLNGAASMVVSTESPVATTMKGNIVNNYNVQVPLPNNPSVTRPEQHFATFTKQGNGIFVIDGQLQVPLGTIEEGGLVVTDSNGFQTQHTQWTIEEKGFLAVQGLDNQTAVNCVKAGSSGILALTSDQTTELVLKTEYIDRTNLIIGAWGNVDYGTADATLSTVTDTTYGNVWRLGGGTGTLNVHFLLTGDAHLLIGNEWSSGTVHLTNKQNDFNGDIYLFGTGNVLTYEDGALGSARISLSYGNTVALHNADQVGIIKEGSSGILALAQDQSFDIDLTGKSMSLGAVGEITYSGNLTVDETYRLGGSGYLTLDTVLDGSKGQDMKLDGQGTSGSHVTFARENAFSGAIVAGGGLEQTEPNSTGDIGIHVTDANALTQITSLELQKGATLYTDGGNLVVQNLTAQTGAHITNNSTTNSTVQLHISEGHSTFIADGVLTDSIYENENGETFVAGLHLVKTGAGTLTMGTNSSWSGGLEIHGGTVNATVTGSGVLDVAGGVGAANGSIYVGNEGTLHLTLRQCNGRQLGGSILPQTITGTGTVELSGGGAAIFTMQTQAFEGTLRLQDNTRLYLGNNLSSGDQKNFNNLSALGNATIEVTAGSQVRLTNTMRYVGTSGVSTWGDFIIAGDGFEGTDTGYSHENFGTVTYLNVSKLNSGALAIDNNSVVYGDITLADHAAISSSSNGVSAPSQYSISGSIYTGITNRLGGTVRGRILGEGKTLTISGNESMTFTADSANTYGNLVIANGNGNNDDKFALRLNGGKAESQTSTALGTGTVQLNDGLILRLAGTGTANQTDVVYTYTNNINAGKGATIQSYNITNRLTGTVTMTGDSLNLVTAQGGALDLAGGISGSGTLNIGADSRIIIGSAATGTDVTPFSGNVVTHAGTDITLASATAVGSTTTFSGTDSLTLHLDGTADYTLSGINMSGDSSALTLHFDFTNTPEADNENTWNTLTINNAISAKNTIITLDLNMFGDIESGSYTLISTAGTDTHYDLADSLNGRLSLSTETGALVLTVDADNKLYWAANGNTQNWEDANWSPGNTGSLSDFSSGANVMLNDSGVANGNSATSRETIILASDQTAGTIGAQQAAYEITGSGSLTATRLTVGNGGDLKLSNTDGNTFTNGVLVSGAGSKLESGVNMTANIRAENGASYSQTGGTLTGNLHLENADAAIQNATMAGNITTAGSGKLTLNAAKTGGANRTFSFDAGTLTAAANGTFSGTFTYTQDQTTLQASGMSLSYCNVTSTAALDVDTLSMTGCQIMLNHAAGTTTNIDTITGNGSLKKHGSGNLNLFNANLWGMEIKNGGITNISGVVTITNEPLSMGKGTLNLLNGANVTAMRFVAGNTGSSQPSGINIGTGASLTISGATDTDDTNSSFLLAHWNNSASTLVLNGGTLNVLNTSLLMGWDSSGRFEVQSGTANLKGIRFSEQRSNADTLLLGTAESGSGRINLGSGGITGIGNNDTVNLGNGTIGASADYVISGHKEVNLIGTNNGTCFDTAGYTVTVNTALAGAGNMIKAGSGTLLLAGNGAAFNGNITVQEGSLAITQEGKSVLESASSVIINSGTLDISQLNLNGPDDAIRIGLGQTFILSDNASINFGNISANTEYHIFDFSSGLVNGWSSNNLSAEEIIIGGVKLSDMGRANYSISEDGFFSYTLLGDRVIKWNGGETPSRWTQEDTVTSWTNTSESNESTAFVNFDNVAFESDADLTLEGDIHVDDLTIAEGVSLKTAGQLTVHGAMTLGNGFSWDFSGNTTLSFTEATLKTAGKIVVGDGATLVMTNKITGQNNASTAFDHVSGTGHIILYLGADNGVGFNLSAFTGDVTVATGRLQVNTSTFNDASTIYLSTSGSQLVFNATSELKNDVVLGADTTFHVNTPSKGLYTGTISGDLLGEDRKLTKAGGSILTLKGRTTLKTLETKAGQVIIDSPYALIEMVDGAIGDAASGTLKLAEGASLRLTGDVWSRSNTGILVEKGAELALLKHEICIINTNGEETSLKATTSGGQLYSLANSNYEIKNARVVFTGSESATLGNKLTNVTLENSISNAVAPANLEDGADDTVYAGSKLTVTHAENTLNGVIAYGGDIALHNLQSETELNLLEIAAGKTVSAYVGDAADECSTVKVTESLLLSGSSTLNASLTLADGATLEMTGLELGAVNLNGALTFEGSVTLGDQLLASVGALEYGDTLTLFTGLNSLSLPGEADLGDSDGMVLTANTLFSNVQDTNLYVNYHMAGNVGSLSIAYIPEPTTSTLSLLALAGLCARRRRK